jgi:hypothetical protein
MEEILIKSFKIATLRNEWYPGRIIDTFNIMYKDSGKTLADVSAHANSHSRGPDSDRVCIFIKIEIYPF